MFHRSDHSLAYASLTAIDRLEILDELLAVIRLERYTALEFLVFDEFLLLLIFFWRQLIRLIICDSGQ